MGTTSSLTSIDDSILFFDGVCNLCTRSVMFVLKHDRKQNFKFASLQSEFAKKWLAKYGYNSSFESIVLLQKGRIYKKSDAALEIAYKLNFPWPLLYCLKIFPKAFRNYFYDFVSRNRYQWFGKSDHCMIPTPELSERFVG